MWSVIPQSDFEKRLIKYHKKWPHEVLNALDNLDTVKKTLDAGARPAQIKQFGFAHSEPSGIIAIDQKGKGKGTKPKAIRLYVYPDEGNKALYVMTIGDKDTQHEDIKECVAFVNGLLQNSKGDAGKKTKDDE